MQNNEVLASLCSNQKFSGEKVVEIFALGDTKVTIDEVNSWLKAVGEPDYAELSDKMMATFLNALVLFKRGKDDALAPRPLELPITSNIVLKKLRVAFMLQESDIQAIVAKQNFASDPREWNSYFRKSMHKNFRTCPDEFLQTILKGLPV